MPATFPITYGPTFPVERESAPRVNVSNFGDGYEQRSGDGINIVRWAPEVTWADGLLQSEAMGADAFLLGLQSQTAFLWTYPGDASPTKWVATKWKPMFVSAGNWGFTMTLKRDFNP